MTKKILVVMLCLIFLVIFVSTLQSQGPKKTITLPNGEVIYDLNGEWDYESENYGPWSQYGRGKGIVKITQEGSSFQGIRMTSGLYAKGGLAIKSELDKNGFRKVELYTGEGFLDIKSQISDDGNKIIVDDGEKVRVTYIKK